MGISFLDAVLRDARQSAVGSFAEATLAGPVFMFFPWLLLSTLRARGPSRRVLLGVGEVTLWMLLNWWVAPSTAIPWYIAYRLTPYGRGDAAASNADKEGAQAKQSKSKNKSASPSVLPSSDAGVSLDRGKYRMASLVAQLAYGVIVSSALPATLMVLGQVLAKHAAKSWLPWSYDASHGLLTSLIQQARVNDMTSMLTWDSLWTALAISAHTLLTPLTPRSKSGAPSAARLLVSAILLPALFLGNYLTAGAPWALGLAAMEWGLL